MRARSNDQLEAHVSERTCILTRRTAPREELIRLALGPDGTVAPDVRARAAEALERREAASREERRGLGVDDALAELPHLTEQMLVTLGKAGIKTLDDLADLATDELIQKKRQEPRRRAENAPKRAEDKGGILADYSLTEEQGNEIIMAARAHWFEDEEPATPAAEEDAVAGEEQ